MAYLPQAVVSTADVGSGVLQVSSWDQVPGSEEVRTWKRKKLWKRATDLNCVCTNLPSRTQRTSWTRGLLSTSQ